MPFTIGADQFLFLVQDRCAYTDHWQVKPSRGAALGTSRVIRESIVRTGAGLQRAHAWMPKIGTTTLAVSRPRRCAVLRVPGTKIIVALTEEFALCDKDVVNHCTGRSQPAQVELWWGGRWRTYSGRSRPREV